MSAHSPADHDAEPDAIIVYELPSRDEYKRMRARQLFDTMREDNRTENEQDIFLEFGFTLVQVMQLHEEG